MNDLSNVDSMEEPSPRTQLPDALGTIVDGVFHLHTKFSVVMHLDGTKYLVTNQVDEMDRVRTRDGEGYQQTFSPPRATVFRDFGAAARWMGR